MVRHVILWQLREELADGEKTRVAGEIKQGLEGLVGQILGLLSLTVYTEPLETSNADLMLDSLFEDEQALHRYSGHPAHVAVAEGKVRPFVRSRVCLDCEA